MEEEHTTHNKKSYIEEERKESDISDQSLNE